jgi:hypothetical protein
MRRYARSDELRVRLQRFVREWTRSSLLSAEQRRRLEPDLEVDLRRTHLMLRLGLALFTLIAAGAAVALTFVTLDFRDDGVIAVICLLLGAGAFAAADTLVARYRLYRFGVEEALAAVSVILFGAGAFVAVNSAIGSSHDVVATTAALMTCAAVSGAAYVRFGFRYAAVAATMFTAFVPLALDASSGPARRLLSAAVFAIAYLVARRVSHQADEIAEDDASMVAACAILGAYLVLNLHSGIDVLGLWRLPLEPWFKWTTYALIWLMPGLAIWRGIVDRDRLVIRAGAATALVTLITNKPYLGWPRQTWDPMLLGVFLAVVALVLRRWLASGPDGERNGFTPVRILHTDAESLQVASLASAAIHLNPDRPAPSQPDGFGGGRSGGGGAGADF